MDTDYGLTWLIATLGIFAIFIGIIVFAILILYFVGLWKLFKKAGKNGWEAIIPFYNTWVLVEISGLAWWYFLLIISRTIASILKLDSLDSLCQLIALVASFFCYYNISKKIHKDVGFAILMTLFPWIMIPVIGLSNHYQIDQSIMVSEHGPINGEKQSNTVRNENNVRSEEKNDGENSEHEIRFCPHCGNQLDAGVKYCGKCGKEI